MCSGSGPLECPQNCIPLDHRGLIPFGILHTVGWIGKNKVVILQGHAGESLSVVHVGWAKGGVYVYGVTGQRGKIEVMDVLQRAGVPAGAVLDAQEQYADSELRRCGTFVTVEHPVRGEVTIPGWPVRLAASQVPVHSAPLLGAHTAQVMEEWLGLSASEIADFSPPTGSASNSAQ